MYNAQYDGLNFIRFVATHRPYARAQMRGSPEYAGIRGQILFYPLNDRHTIVLADIRGLPTSEETCEQPVFALHIHEGTACTGDGEDPFKNTGTHYNPENCPHPQHAGDLPPLFGTRQGRAWDAVLSDRFSAREVIGRTVILHRHPDDFKTQPSGDAGEKIACGVIERIFH